MELLRNRSKCNVLPDEIYEVGSTILMEHYCNVFFKNP